MPQFVQQPTFRERSSYFLAARFLFTKTPSGIAELALNSVTPDFVPNERYGPYRISGLKTNHGLY